MRMKKKKKKNVAQKIVQIVFDRPMPTNLRVSSAE